MKQVVVNKVKNSGLILEPPEAKDYCSTLFKETKEPILGRISPLKKPSIIFEDGKGWLQVAKSYGLPEIQFNRNFDSYSCVVFGIAKAMCYYLFKKYGIKITISEMYNAFYAGVIPNRGTTVSKGFKSFKEYGWVRDRDYPFTKKTTAKEFFAKPPKTIQIMAAGKLTEWEFHYEVIPNNLKSISESYERTPVVLSGFAWASYYGEGVYYDYNNTANHVFVGLELNEKGNNMIDDTYPKDFEYREEPTKDELIKELHSTFKYGSAHICWLTPTDKTKQTLLTYIINMFKKISRDIHGGFWFIKKKDGVEHKQKIENWKAMLGSIIDEVGVEKNNLTDAQLAKIANYNFFGNN